MARSQAHERASFLTVPLTPYYPQLFFFPASAISRYPHYFSNQYS
ncbi:hypothetical protein [Emticicia agri]|nr:hypothetical protein [Emticicia agri]